MATVVQPSSKRISFPGRRRNALKSFQATINLLEMTKEENRMCWEIVAKNKRILSGTPSLGISRQDISCTGKANKKIVEKIVGEVDRSMDAKKDAKIRNGHKESGYTDWQQRVSGSFEKNSR